MFWKKRPKLPYLHAEVDVSGTMSVTVGWNKPTNQQEYNHIVNIYANLMILLQNTKFFVALQHAIDQYGKQIGDQGVVCGIFNTYTNTINNQKQNSNNQPVVSPLAAFKT